MSVPLPMTFMSVQMDRPMNQAHKHERVGEDHMRNGRWDDAERSFLLALQLMKKAMDGVTRTQVIQSIQLQIKRLETMKHVIDRKRSESSSSKSPVKEHTQHSYSASTPGEDTPKNNNHMSTTKTEKKLKSEAMKENNKWTLIPHDIQHLIEEREHDSLLQFLNLPIESSEYKATDTLNSSSSFKKIPKSQESIIEEYKVQNDLLRNAALGFWKELDKAEKENKMLKKLVDDLQSEVWSLNERLMNIQEDIPSPIPSSYNNDVDDNVKPYLGFLSDKVTTDPMIASIIVQPESFFEFEGKDNDIASELLQAVADDGDSHYDKGKNLSHLPNKGALHKVIGKQVKQHNYHHSKSRGKEHLENSVKYEELDEECNTEVADTISDSSGEVASTRREGSSNIHFDIAGLPPLSPVHFELDEKQRNA